MFDCLLFVLFCFVLKTTFLNHMHSETLAPWSKITVECYHEIVWYVIRDLAVIYNCLPIWKPPMFTKTPNKIFFFNFLFGKAVHKLEGIW